MREFDTKKREGQINNKNRRKKVRSIRTYRDFAVDALKNKPSSLAQMIIAEKKKKELEHNYSPKNKKNIFFIVLSIFAILLSILTITAVLFFVIQKQEELERKDIITVEHKSLIPFNFMGTKSLDGIDRSEKLKFIKEITKEITLPIGDIKIIQLIKKCSEGYSVFATPTDFFETLETRIPDQLKRNFLPEWTLGILSISEGKLPFIILKIRDFDTSFATIFEWERYLLFDLGLFFGVEQEYFNKRFVDVSLNNIDARVILDKEANVIFGYSFIDTETLIFFNNSTKFRHIIDILRHK